MVSLSKDHVVWVVSTLFYDTVVHFVAPPPPLLRRVRGRRSSITVPGYPKTWMLLTSCLMAGMDAFRGHAPPSPIPNPISTVKHARICGQASYERIERLEELVFLNSGTFFQYQS